MAHDTHRLLLIDGTPVHFGPLEYRVLRHLLDHAESAVALNDLTHAAFERDADVSARAALDKHIDRLRSKLRPFGIAVAYVSNFGYILLLRPSHQ